jgi:hypothetical protein
LAKLPRKKTGGWNNTLLHNSGYDVLRGNILWWILEYAGNWYWYESKDRNCRILKGIKLSLDAI